MLIGLKGLAAYMNYWLVWLTIQHHHSQPVKVPLKASYKKYTNYKPASGASSGAKYVPKAKKPQGECEFVDD